MGREAKGCCTECQRIFGETDDRKPEKLVKKAAKTSSLCGQCYYSRYYKDNKVKKDYMTVYRRQNTVKRRTVKIKLFDSYLKEITDGKI